MPSTSAPGSSSCSGTDRRNGPHAVAVPVGTSLDAGGAATIALPPLPPDPLLAGFRVHAQAFVLDSSLASGVSMTRGLTLRLGF